MQICPVPRRAVCVIACTSLKSEEEGAVPPRNTLLVTSLIRSLIKGGFFMPLPGTLGLYVR